MIIEYDENKRKITLEMRELDFKDSLLIFKGKTYNAPSPQLHGEMRMITIGVLKEDVIVLV